MLGEHIYWTDWQEYTVERANKRTGQDRRIMVSHLEDLMSLQTSAMRPDKATWTNACVSNPCSHLCLNTPIGRVCECPTGQELSQANGKRKSIVI